MNTATAFVAPQQARSRRSLDRVLDAVEDLLLRKEFDDISLAEIVRRAGVSIGSLYARFGSKDTLLDVLHERYEHERSAFLSEAFRAISANAPLTERAKVLCETIVSLFRARRGVLRSLVLRHWRRSAQTNKRTLSRLDIVFAEASVLLLDARTEIRHENPEAAVRLGLSVVLATCRENIVLRPTTLPGSLAMDDEALSAELARLLVAYLTEPPLTARKRRRLQG